MVGEHVVGLALTALHNLVLDGDRNLHEDVVLGLGLHHDIELAHLQADLVAHAINPRQLEVQASVRHGHELTQALHNGSLTGTHDVVTIENGQNNRQQNNADKNHSEHWFFLSFNSSFNV